MVYQTEEHSLRIVRDERTQSRLQRRCLAGSIIRIDDDVRRRNINVSLYILCLMAQYNDYAFEPTPAKRLHDRFEECAATKGKCGLGGSHAGRLARSED